MCEVRTVKQKNRTRQAQSSKGMFTNGRHLIAYIRDLDTTLKKTMNF